MSLLAFACAAALAVPAMASGSPATEPEYVQALRDRLSAKAAPPASASTPEPTPLSHYPPEAPGTSALRQFPLTAARPAYPPQVGAPTPPLPACGVISDCSFEAGGTGWVWSDLNLTLFPVGVYPAGVDQGYGFFSTAPTDGALCLVTGWDGDGPGDITLHQDVILQPDATHLDFDYRAAWNNTGALPRTFAVELQPSGGGTPLLSQTVLTAAGGTSNMDTGNNTATVNIAAYAGQPVRIVFRWHVPQFFTGPAMFQLDRVGVRENLCRHVANCSFETGDFTGWLTTNHPSPFYALSVLPPGFSVGFGLFTSSPADGAVSAVHGFDGGGPGDYLLEQDVVLPPGASSLQFRYRAGWDMANFGGSTRPREFWVELRPSGGGAALVSQLVLLAPAGTVLLDSGSRLGALDVSAYAGQAVRIAFRWHIPETFTGPGQFELDRVVITEGGCAAIANCSFEAGALPMWSANDLATPFFPIGVQGAGLNLGFGLFTGQPTHGQWALITGFDGSGPGTIEAWQDVAIPLWADQLRFDYRAGWDMFNFPGSTRPRRAHVDVEPFGGGPPLASHDILVAPPQTVVYDTGPLSRTIPVGAYAGQSVRLAFRWDIPENFTGPAMFQLDRVMLDNSVLAVGPGGSPGVPIELGPATPNPSRDASVFRFALRQAGGVDLEVVDVRGALVWKRHQASLSAGEHRLEWDGRRTSGEPAAPGVYYARVRSVAGSTSRMFVRVR